MKLSSFDPFTRVGKWVVARFALDEFQTKRLAKLWWAAFAVGMGYSIRYWGSGGDWILALLVGTVSFLTYWRNWRMGSFRCRRCRHVKGPEDMGRLISGDMDGPDPLIRLRIVAVLALLAASCIGAVWGPFVSGAIPVAGFCILGRIEALAARRFVDRRAVKECASCVIKFAQLDSQLASMDRALKSFSEGISLRLDPPSYPNEPHPISIPARKEGEGDLEIVIEER